MLKTAHRAALPGDAGKLGAGLVIDLAAEREIGRRQCLAIAIEIIRGVSRRAKLRLGRLIILKHTGKIGAGIGIRRTRTYQRSKAKRGCETYAQNMHRLSAFDKAARLTQELAAESRKAPFRRLKYLSQAERKFYEPASSEGFGPFPIMLLQVASTNSFAPARYIAAMKDKVVDAGPMKLHLQSVKRGFSSVIGRTPEITIVQRSKRQFTKVPPSRQTVRPVNV